MTETNHKDNIRLFSLSANQELAEEISERLHQPLSPVEISRFEDGEISINIEDSVRGADIFLIQPTSHPVNDNYMEIFIMTDALKRASAETVTVVMPYYGYQRSDRIAAPREPISAKLVANLLVRSGVDHLIGVDLHAPQVQGFYNIPVEHLTAIPILSNYFESHYLKDQAVVVSPNHSGASRGREYAENMDLPMVMVDNRYSEISNKDELSVIGDVVDQQCIIVDDLIDTGRTVSEVAYKLKEEGASEVYVLATHLVLSEGAKDRLEKAPIEKIIATNSIDLTAERDSDLFEQISIANLLVEGIHSVHDYYSLQKLYDSDYWKDYKEH